MRGTVNTCCPKHVSTPLCMRHSTNLIPIVLCGFLLKSVLPLLSLSCLWSLPLETNHYKQLIKRLNILSTFFDLCWSPKEPTCHIASITWIFLSFLSLSTVLKNTVPSSYSTLTLSSTRLLIIFPHLLRVGSLLYPNIIILNGFGYPAVDDSAVIH